MCSLPFIFDNLEHFEDEFCLLIVRFNTSLQNVCSTFENCIILFALKFYFNDFINVFRVQYISFITLSSQLKLNFPIGSCIIYRSITQFGGITSRGRVVKTRSSDSKQSYKYVSFFRYFDKSFSNRVVTYKGKSFNQTRI